MAVNSAAQILSCIKANTKIRYFLNKERPDEQIKLSLMFTIMGNHDFKSKLS